MDQGALQDALIGNLAQVSGTATDTMRDLAKRMGSEFKDSFAESRREDGRYYSEELKNVDKFSKEASSRLSAVFKGMRADLIRAAASAPESAGAINEIIKGMTDRYAVYRGALHQRPEYHHPGP